MSTSQQTSRSAATEALLAAGDREQAEDISALESAADSAQRKLAIRRKNLVTRMIFGSSPSIAELCSGADRMRNASHEASDNILSNALNVFLSGQAFTADNKISRQLRRAVAMDKAYGFTVPLKFSGLGLSYSQLACLEENFAANGLGSLAIEISGQLTIGSSALIGYGTETQCSTFLPLIADGTLIAFALTEVGVGVNAKRVQAWVERDDEHHCWRLHAEGDRGKLYITSATHGGLAAIAARKGRNGREIGLFIVELPKTDMEGEYHFKCIPSNVSAFGQNINSKLTFRDFPIPLEHEIQGNGVEVLFYCLRMGRCMLAAMSAGYQRMMVASAVNYAKQREGVGGKVIRHELPRLAITKMLGGALTSQALAHLSLAQDADGVDLTGLKDLTKSASARYALDSLIACEHVMGGRSFDKDSAITQARPSMHAFGVVEGEDNLIRLGMVKDVTADFTDRYMKGILSVLQELNTGADGNPVPADARIYRLSPASVISYPRRSLRAFLKLPLKGGFWRLTGWIAVNGIKAPLRLPGRLIPTTLLPRYRTLPQPLARHLRFSEQGLRGCRWTYLALNLFYQLELTRAQIPLQRLGMRIELLMCIAVVCCHASRLDESCQRIAEAQAELIKNELKALRLLSDLPSLEKLRRSVNAIAADLENGSCSLISTITPQPYAHPMEQE